MDIAFIILKHLQLKKQNHQKYKYLKLKYILPFVKFRYFLHYYSVLNILWFTVWKVLGIFSVLSYTKYCFTYYAHMSILHWKEGNWEYIIFLISFIIGIYCMFYKCDYSKIVWILIKFLEKYYYKPCIINIPEVK